MIPTEHEGTVATDAAARWLYEATRSSTFPTPTFEQIGAMAQKSLREQVLPMVWAALEALPDRRCPWPTEDVQTAIRVLTAKVQNAPDLTTEDVIRQVVADMALLSEGVVTLADFEPTLRRT